MAIDTLKTSKAPMTTPLDDLRVLTSAETARLLTVSAPVMERWRAAGTGPRFVRLSARRIGYRVEDLRTWMTGRAAGGEQTVA